MHRFTCAMVVTIFLSGVVGCHSRTHMVHRKEQVLKEDLFTMRQAIDQYTQEKNRAPQSLEDLVRAGYLRAVPVDPMTNSPSTWQLIQEDSVQTLDQIEAGVTDVHSGSNQISTDGTRYSSW